MLTVICCDQVGNILDEWTKLLLPDDPTVGDAEAAVFRLKIENNWCVSNIHTVRTCIEISRLAIDSVRI